ncbi:MAG: hypothetical protein AB9873_18395 [Syntrophobacteraceae bacterium]
MENAGDSESKKPQREITAIYYAMRLLENVIDESTYHQARRLFLESYPEYSEEVHESYDPSTLQQLRDRLQRARDALTFEERIWAEEYETRLRMAYGHAMSVLNRSFHEVMGRSFELSPDSIEEMRALREELIRLRQKASTKNKKEEYRRAHLEVEAAENVLCMNATWNFTKLPDSHMMVCLLFDFGEEYGRMISCHPDRVAAERIAHQSAFASKAVCDARWSLRNTALRDALAEAEKRWEDGDDCFHHEMAEFLSKKYSALSRKVLKRELKPIARRYDRLFGIKGVKKEKQ